MALLDELRTRLGVADKSADEGTVLAALDEALAEQTGTPTASATPPAGMVLIPQAALADLQAAAATTRELADQARATERDRVLDRYRDRYAPASRAAWERQYDVDPTGTTSYLEAAPVIVPLAELGSAGSPDPSEDDATFAALFPTTREV